MKNLIEVINEKLKINSKSKIDNPNALSNIKDIYNVLYLNDKNPFEYPKDKIDYIKEEIKYWFDSTSKNIYVVTNEDSLKIYDKNSNDSVYPNLLICDDKFVNDFMTNKFEKSKHIYTCQNKLSLYKTNEIFYILIKLENTDILLLLVDNNKINIKHN